jgi:glutamine amidotransferase
MIAIIDYGTGNLGSMANMLKRVGAEAVITAEAAVIERADRIILPGIGAFDNGMNQLADRGLISVLKEQVIEKRKPFLGVCLGMQLLAEGSEEGKCEGLGWIKGTVKKFSSEGSPPLKIPHMGWNTVKIAKPDRLFEGMTDDARFYFVHSYYLSCDPESVVGRTDYGPSFVSAVRNGNIAGVQFHPEKSHRFGMRVLSNFAEVGE